MAWSGTFAVDGMRGKGTLLLSADTHYEGKSTSDPRVPFELEG
jgi:hypothetical protein